MKKKLLVASVFALLMPFQLMHAQNNVIMYIGDGFGIAPKTAARMALGQGTTGKKLSTDPNFRILALDKLKNVAMVTTHSQNSWITDSGPGASVYACGKPGKIDNEAIAYSVSFFTGNGYPICFRIYFCRRFFCCCCTITQLSVIIEPSGP